MPLLSPIDRLITHIDTFIKTTTGSIGEGERPSPALSAPETELSAQEQRYSARLMRINHCGEVCAQALYNGQALTARDSRTSTLMQQAASEEVDHLTWCEQRIKELDSHVSFLNPFWYAVSFSMGALTGLLGDKVNLDEHLGNLPAGDEKSRSILRQMRDDESRHATTAMEHGGAPYPESVKLIMRQVSKLMTRSTYWL